MGLIIYKRTPPYWSAIKAHRGLIPERRFSTWQIGEVHVNSKLKPNARRDGFEECPEYEYFLERMHGVAQILGKTCRYYSKERANTTSIIGTMNKLEKATSFNFIVDEQHRQKKQAIFSDELENLKLKILNKPNLQSYARKINSIDNKFHKKLQNVNILEKNLDGRKLNAYSRQDILKDIALGILANHCKYETSEELLYSIMKPYLKNGKIA